MLLPFQYKRERDLLADFKRMFNNAKLYNEDESDIFRNASRLERLLSRKVKMLMSRKEKLLEKNAAPKAKASNEKVAVLLAAVKTATDHRGRILSTVFVDLPSKVDYPDYYREISQPIDLKRIESTSYETLDGLTADLQLLFDNACLYNQPGSTIYRVRRIALLCLSLTHVSFRTLWHCEEL